MKTRIISFIVLFLLASCSLLAQSVETRTVPNFNQLKVCGSWDVIIKKGNQNEVRLEANNLSLEKVITEVKDGILNIRLEKGNYRNVDLEVTVTYQELEAVHSSGSGNLKSMDPLVADELKVSLSGSGNASFNRVTADRLELTMSGSGDLIIREGSVGEVTLKQSGSGNLKAADLEAEDAQIEKSGSGNAALTVNQALSVRASGSGNVEYKGNPSLNDIKISGSGRVVKK
jgi:hypothetical protein